MLKDFLNSDFSCMEIITMFTIVLLIATFSYTVIPQIYSEVKEKQTISSEVITNNEIIVEQKPIVEEELVNTNEKDKSLWHEVKIEVVAGSIVSIISFIAGNVYITTKRNLHENNTF